MELIVAVYEDWGIGKDGTQPVTLSADRKFFREITKGAAVIVGRRTVEDFPGRKPLPGRKNIVLSRSTPSLPGFTVCKSVEEAQEATQSEERVVVIGGGHIYRQLLPLCQKAYVTRLGCCPESDTFFPDLDQEPGWQAPILLQAGEENGIAYQMLLYCRQKT